MTGHLISALRDLTEIRGTRITSVRPVFLSHSYPLEDMPGWSGGRLPGTTAGLVEIRTDAGVSGVGETYAGVFAPDVVRAIVEFHAQDLIGRDPSQVDLLWQECRSRMLYWGRSGIAIATLSAIEAALWDVCGKLANKPVVELLGGACHASLPRYASGGVETDIGRLRAEADGRPRSRLSGHEDQDRRVARGRPSQGVLGPGGARAGSAACRRCRAGHQPQPVERRTGDRGRQGTRGPRTFVVRGTVCCVGRRGLRGVSRSVGHAHRRGRELHHPRRGEGLSWPSARSTSSSPMRPGSAGCCPPSAPASWPRSR